MRVYLLIFDARLFTPPIVEQVAVSGGFELVGVGGVGGRRAGSQSGWLFGQLRYWGIWGSFWIAVASILRAIPGAIGVPRPFRRLSSLAATCDALEIPYDEVADVNDPAFLDRLARLDLDLIVSFQQQIFGPRLLALPRLGCLNVHTGILPGYRGFKPVFRMVSSGEARLGVTVHSMTPALDAGRVVTQRGWRRRPGSSVLENQLWSYRCAAHCIVEAVERMATGGIDQLPEIAPDSPYFKAPTRAERDAAVAAGTRLV